MSTNDTLPVSLTAEEQRNLARARDLQAWIAQGRILPALDEFYAPDCVMQENAEPPVVGLEANREREQAWLDTVQEVLGFEVLATAATGDATFVESRLRYRATTGDEVDLVQVARARWSDGRIVDERFYHA